MRGLVPARARSSGWEHLTRRDVTPPLPALVLGSPQSLLVPEEGGWVRGPALAPCPGTAGDRRGKFGDGQEKSWGEAGASLEQKPQWEGAEPWCRQLEKDLGRCRRCVQALTHTRAPGWSGLAVSGQEVASSRFFWPEEKLEGYSESLFLAHNDPKVIFWI